MKYRIIKKKNRYGMQRYRAQYKWLFFYRDCWGHYDGEPITYETLGEAQMALERFKTEK